MLFSELFLTEGRDSPLYHGTSAKKFLAMLEVNEIQANTRHYISHLKGLGRSDEEEIAGVSLSRSRKMAIDFSPVRSGLVLEIDQRKLSQTNKLIPFDFWSAFTPKKPSIRNQLKSTRRPI